MPMTDDQTTILEGPDGQLYEIPRAKLATFAVPGERVGEIRKRKAAAMHSNQPPNGSHTASVPPGHYAPGELPPGPAAPPATSLTIQPSPHGGGVTLNFYFGAAGPTLDSGNGVHVPPESPHSGSVEGYHMTFDESGIPVNHTDMLWGDYIDKQGNPAVGWHSHDPVTGNAQ